MITATTTEHHHGPANYNTTFAVGVTLNFGFVVSEADYGMMAHSLLLVADAGTTPASSRRRRRHIIFVWLRRWP